MRSASRSDGGSLADRASDEERVMWVNGESGAIGINSPEPFKVVGAFEGRDVKSGEARNGTWYKFTYALDGNPYFTYNAEVDEVMRTIDIGKRVELTIMMRHGLNNVVEAKAA